MMPRKRASPLWSYFTILNKEKCIARCHICQKMFSFKTTITNLKRHVERKHPSEDLVSYIREGREHSSANEDLLEVSDNDWKHLTDHEYMQKKNLAAGKEDAQEEGEVELEFLQDITAADVDRVTEHEEEQHEQQNLTELKSVSGSSPVKKYLKIRKLPFRFNRHPRFTGTAFRVRNLNSSVRSPTKPSTTEDDEFERFGRHVAAQLRQLPLHSSLLVQESIQSLITRERIASLGIPQDSLSDGVGYEEGRINE